MKRTTSGAEARLSRIGLCTLLAVLQGCDDSAGGLPEDATPSVCTNLFPTPAPLPESATPPLPETDGLLLYELQIRSANACDPTLGTPSQREACAQKPAPQVRYEATDSVCNELEPLERIRLGTIEDLIAPTLDPREALTLRYIAERLGANAVWLMPPFPNNRSEQLPDPCDNLGSPYAVTDYFHLDTGLSRDCISDPVGCDPNAAFEALVQEANDRGLRLFLDVAFNHFGRNYRFFDLAAPVPAAALSDDARWDFDATFDPALVNPRLLDATSLSGGNEEIDAARAALMNRCPDLNASLVVSAVALWRWLTPEERAAFRCGEATLERLAPAFYAGAQPGSPSIGPADSFSGPWRDVRFLFHHTNNSATAPAAIRTREYLFRILNFWTAQGVSGFRLDHATDGDSGLSPEVWRYLIAKTRFYAARRGQPPPIFLAEEFGNPAAMAGVADLLTEGYLFGATARGTLLDGNGLGAVLSRTARFDGAARVLTHLENHDERRVTDGTGLDADGGRRRWSAGLSVWSVPMLLAGQEWGETERLHFRRSSLLPGRFDDTLRSDLDRRVARYRDLALHWRSDDGSWLRQRAMRHLPSAASSSLLLLAKWDGRGSGRLILHNLASVTASGAFALPPDVAGQLGLDSCAAYRLVTESRDRELLSCRPAADLTRGFTLLMPAGEERWIAGFEPCGG